MQQDNIVAWKLIGKPFITDECNCGCLMQKRKWGVPNWSDGLNWIPALPKVIHASSFCVLHQSQAGRDEAIEEEIRARRRQSGAG